MVGGGSDRPLHVLSPLASPSLVRRCGPLFFPTWAYNQGEGHEPAPAGRPSTVAYRNVMQGLDLDGPEVGHRELGMRMMSSGHGLAAA